MIGHRSSLYDLWPPLALARYGATGVVLRKSLVNFGFMAGAVLTTDEVVSSM